MEEAKADDVISESRLRGLLAFINPAKREDWLEVIFAVREARVLNEHLELVDDADVLQLCDDWASTALHGACAPRDRLPEFWAGTYQGWQDTEDLFYGRRGTRGRVRIASLVYKAKEHAKEKGVQVPERLCRPGPAEWFKVQPGSTPGAPDTGAPDTGASTGRFQSGRFTFLDPDADDNTPDPEWLIPDLLMCNSQVLIVGKSRSFKTFIALDMALSIALGDGADTGRAWPKVTRPGAVLFAAGEGGSGLKQRRRAWEARHNGGKKVPGFVRVSSVPQINSEADAEAFIAGAKGLHPEGYRAVVIDTAIRAMQGQNPNSQEAATALTALVERIGQELAPDEYGCTVLVLHHPGQGDEDRPAGSFVFISNVDTALLVKRQGTAMAVDLSMLKQKDAPEWEAPRQIKLEASEGSIVAVGAGSDTSGKPVGSVPDHQRSKNDPRRDAFVLEAIDVAAEEALRSIHGGYRNRSEVARMVHERTDTGLCPRSIDRHLKTLSEDKDSRCFKLIDSTRTTRQRQWRPPDTGKGDPFAPACTPSVRRR